MGEPQARPGGAEQAPGLVTPTVLREWPLPDPRGTKDAKGRLVVVGGSVSTPGAVLLAAEAAMRVGAGKVQVATTAGTAVALGVALPEAFVLGLDEDDGGDIAPVAAGRLLEQCDGADAVLLGPGIGAPEAACALLEGVVPHLDVPVVIDALGTAYLTERSDGVRHLADRALLTPNATELSKVLDEEAADVDRDMLSATRRACARTGATVLSGSDVSYVVAPDG
ncbi:MAG TPA: ADP/ATP-dependent (S)-NAD(P)H-hydrate dehydratase, partial [Ornithinibacter sp.]|nr:ADP/ATP-dependent (S)-NAD(P)H-hydrate dehydratase [Ornithinibacter sp.]